MLQFISPIGDGGTAVQSSYGCYLRNILELSFKVRLTIPNDDHLV